jgi:DNA-binding GntR family transcriptional regulator
MVLAESTTDSSAAKSLNAVERIYRGIMREIEDHDLVPGQRLVEVELASRFGVGRNAVREALKHLAERGVIVLSRNKSPSIRFLDLAETFEVLEVARSLNALAARIAAENFRPAEHGEALDESITHLGRLGSTSEPRDFARARRRFYRTLLTIGGNRELQRLFPAIGMHIIFSQFRSRRLQAVRIADYQEISDAVRRGDGIAAYDAAGRHVDEVRLIISETKGGF